MRLRDAMVGKSKDPMALLALARERSGSDRFALATSITEIYAEHAAELSEKEAGLIGEILDQLVRAFEMDLRRDLAERLAGEPAVPRSLILLLANDRIEVAGPVLRRSRLLTTDDLLAIIHEQGREHQLAIASRRPLESAVSAALVEAADVAVIEALLRNSKARLGKAALEHLVGEARWIERYREPLVRRPDLTESLAERLYGLVSEVLRREICQRFGLDRESLERALDRDGEAVPTRSGSVDLGPPLPASLSGGGKPSLRRSGDAESAQGGRKTAPDKAPDKATVAAQRLIALLRGGDSATFKALLAGLSRLDAPRIECVLERPSGRAMAWLCRALGMGKADFAVLLFLTRKLRIGNEVEDPRDVARLMGFYEALDARAARAALLDWGRAEDFRSVIVAADSDPSPSGETPRGH